MRSTQALTFTLFIVAICASGCSRERLRCYETAASSPFGRAGCYYCDGLGCREVDPGDRPLCSSDSDCGAGQLCSAAGCIDQCSGAVDCGGGYVCNGSLCLEPGEEIPVLTPGTCVESAGCADGRICIDGRCTVVPPPPSCSRDSDCSGATPLCDDASGTCVACRFADECGAGATCVDAECREACGIDNPCGAGLRCNGSFCEAIPPETGMCTSDASCPGGHTCIDGVCVAHCTSDAGCGAGFICDLALGACEPGIVPNPFCRIDSDCSGDSRCIVGACRVTCPGSGRTGNEYCLRADVGLPFCVDFREQSVSVCVTSQIATSNCGTSAECDAGEHCIDGACRL